MKAETVKYMLLIIVQVLLWNFCDFTQFLLIVYLPSLILFLPVNQNVSRTLCVAFLVGFVTDFFSASPLGLTSLALVPVAFLRKYVIMFVFGSEVYSRGEELSIARQGRGKVMFSIILVTVLFLVLYIAADSAGSRPVWIDLVKLLVSLLVSAPLSLYIVGEIFHEESSIWK